jgi:hypothetical protein
VPSAPKLLLDANIFRQLAHGELAAFENRLLALAAHRSPPLLWTCPITFDEIACHIRSEEADRFPQFRAALMWMEKLCGNSGMAEDLSWVLRRAVFVGPVPYDGAVSQDVNRTRRQLINAARFADIPEGLLRFLGDLRQETRQRIDDWTAMRSETLRMVRIKPKPGEATVEGSEAVARVMLRVSRKNASDEIPLWGPLRPEAEQLELQREMIAFSLSDLMKAKASKTYSPGKNDNDYNDGWLLAYPAVGYLVVTQDRRLRRAIEIGGCKDPRVVGLDAALPHAEAWLARTQ